ncbi:MAG: phosphoglycerate dehydrogenase [Planctomycetota bacterium]
MTDRFRVLISDPLPAEAKTILEATGQIEVVEQRDDIEPLLPSIHGWIVRSGTQVTAELLEQAPQLRCVCRAGAGVDNVDQDAATRHGVVVMNTPGSNSRAAAELTVGLLLSLARNIPFAHARMMGGEWGRKDYVGIECQGKTVAIVGMGKVGRHVGTMARGLGMDVIAVDPFLSPEAAADLGFQLRTIDEALPDIDFLTLHTPLTDATRNFINAERLQKCRPSLRIVNCSRGGVIDEVALLEALEKGQIAGAALDVFAAEPPPAESPLRSHPKIITTPHLGASTLEAQEQVATASGEQVRDFLCAGTVRNAINAASLAGEEAERYAPLAELATRLGMLQAQVLRGSPQAVTIELQDPSATDVLERLVVDNALTGFLQASADTVVNAVNARVFARERGIEVATRSPAHGGDWIRSVGITVRSPEGEQRVLGSVVGRSSLRLVGFNEYKIDSALEGPLLVMDSIDRPGMMGTVGSVFGELGLNIANLTLGRSEPGGAALSVVQLDDAPDAAALERINAIDGVRHAYVVNMPNS